MQQHGQEHLPHSGKPKTYTKSGFVRTHDFNHIYPEIEEDVKRLILEGWLVEFKDNNTLHELIKKQNANTNKKENEKMATVLYPVDLREAENRDIEVRRDQGQFPQESLNILGQLWNDPRGQLRDEEFNWQEIIEKNGLLDEKEYTHYMYRKDKLSNFDADADLKNEIIARGRGRRGGQKNDHLNFDFMTNIVWII